MHQTASDCDMSHVSRSKTIVYAVCTGEHPGNGMRVIDPFSKLSARAGCVHTAYYVRDAEREAGGTEFLNSTSKQPCN